MTGQRTYRQSMIESLAIAEKERDEARTEAERLRVQLAGCGVAAMSNTEETYAAGALEPGSFGHSASYDDVREAVRREMDLRERHINACALVAKMHAAAVGEVTGPKRGVVEDVEDEIERLRLLIDRAVDWLEAAVEVIADSPGDLDEEEEEGVRALVVELHAELDRRAVRVQL